MDQNKTGVEKKNCVQMEERGVRIKEHNFVEMEEIGEMDEDCAKMEQEEIGDMEKGGGKNGIINTAASKIRKRCGSCPGCLLDESCGICGPCLRKQRAEIIAQRPHEICKERKCHVLKKEKSQRCGECAGCQSLPCGICVFCCGQNQNLCKTKRCCNRTWIKMIPKTITHEKMYFGLGIKIKPKSKSNKPKEIEINEDFVIFEDEFSDLAVQNDQLNEMPIESSAGDLTDSKKGMINDLETQQKSKQRSSKSVKRSKKCGKCSDCQAEDCGNCRGCQINREYSEDKLILGKVPCLGNRCNFPEDLTGDMDAITLMKQQDDSSNGTVCPVKVVNGILYDFRCYFCKKLPRVGSANRSELMRHYSIHHFADQLKEEFSINMHQGHCSLCDLNLKGKNIPSHFGQKHNEVVRYLPLEAAALCPEDIKEGKRNVPHHPALAVSQKKNTLGSLDSQQLSSDYDPSSVNGDSLYEDKEELIKKDDVVEGWIIENGNSKEKVTKGISPTVKIGDVKRDETNMSTAFIRCPGEQREMGASSSVQPRVKKQNQGNIAVDMTWLRELLTDSEED